MQTGHFCAHKLVTVTAHVTFFQAPQLPFAVPCMSNSCDLTAHLAQHELGATISLPWSAPMWTGLDDLLLMV